MLFWQLILTCKTPKTSQCKIVRFLDYCEPHHNFTNRASSVLATSLYHHSRHSSAWSSDGTQKIAVKIPLEVSIGGYLQSSSIYRTMDIPWFFNRPAIGIPPWKPFIFHPRASRSARCHTSSSCRRMRWTRSQRSLRCQAFAGDGWGVDAVA